MAKRRVSNPFETVSHRTERTAAAKLAECLNQIIREENLSFGEAEVETGGADTRFPDIVLHRSPQSQIVLVVIEAKPPAFNPLSEDELKEPARRKATERQAPYFCTTNFKDLWCFITEEVNRMSDPARQVFQRYRLSAVEDLDRLDEPSTRSSIYRSLKQFLADLSEAVDKKRPTPRLPIDKLLVMELQSSITALSGYYRFIIEQKAAGDAKFRKLLASWFSEQTWTFLGAAHDYERAARQTAYLLVNKVLFYSAIQPVRRLSRLEIPASLTSGATLQSFLQGYFNEVLKIDYESIYITDFIDQLAFPEDRKVIEEVKGLVRIAARYDFSTLGYDVIGRIFEQLIPPDERHILGQYFTAPDVVDLILRFCLCHESDTVFDPSCGAGTFLVRAYSHKKLMNQRLEHEQILSSLWGNDIAKFPVHLATINLAVNDLRSNENFPNVVQNDFFDLNPYTEAFPVRGGGRKVRVKSLAGQERTVQHPRYFDCIVGNPPYTRSEEIQDMREGKPDYRKAMAEKALCGEGGGPVAHLSGRAGIHAYFFVHGTKFLRQGGLFGFIVANSWLDAAYGAGLQEHFLDNYKITAVIESKVERWFSDADVNTCIVILQKAAGEDSSKARESNVVRFVQVLKPLTHFIPPPEAMWAAQVGRRDAIDNLVRTILGHTSYYENDELRIFPKKQSDLRQEGTDKETSRYVGGKWGIYIRGNPVLHDVLKQGAHSLVRLSTMGAVRRGFTTGADPWFYVEAVTEEAAKGKLPGKARARGVRIVKSGDGTIWPIEEIFLRPVLKNPDAYRTIAISPAEIKDLILKVPPDCPSLERTLLKKYIRHGETSSYKMGKDRTMVPAETRTCAARAEWYVLPEIAPTRVHWQKAFDRYYRHCCTSEPVLANQRFYQIAANHGKDDIPLCFSINSSFTALWLEAQRAALGLGALEATVGEVQDILVLNPKMLSAKDRRRIEETLLRVSQEHAADLCSEEISESRGRLDDLFLELMGFKNASERKVVLVALQAALREAVADRFQRAESFQKNSNGRDIDIRLVVRDLEEKLEGQSIGNFYRTQVARMSGLVRELPAFARKAKIEHSLYGCRLESAKTSMDCRSESEARFLLVFAIAGFREVLVPDDEQELGRIVEVLEPLLKWTEAALDEVTSSILQKKLRDQVVKSYWASVRKAASAD